VGNTVNQRGGGGTLACGKGVGESQIRRGDIDIHCGNLYLYVLPDRNAPEARVLKKLRLAGLGLRFGLASASYRGLGDHDRPVYTAG
jgi:hypothetical protein